MYLEKPNKDIEFDEGENEHLKFAAGSMQGWRINMVSNLSLMGEEGFVRIGMIEFLNPSDTYFRVF